MAESTPLILAGGAVVVAHQVLVANKAPGDLVITGVGIALAGLAAAGLDTALPGLGRGTAALMLVAALLAYAPTLAGKVLKDKGK